MTPERKAEIDAAIKWWRQCEDWRVNGFNIVNNDPLFAPRKTIPKPPERQRTLHARLGWEWLEVGNECDFTGAVKYVRYQGDLLRIDFEMEYYIDVRLWKSFWKETTIRKTYWCHDDNLEDKYPHSKNNEDVTYECES